LDPSAAINLTALVEFIGLVVALLVVTFDDGLSSVIFGRRRHLEVPFRAVPGVLVIAAAAVLLSVPLRSLHGGCIYNWNRLAWAVTFVVSAAVFIKVLLHQPAGSSARAAIPA
jgi:hypothetical protein